MARRSMLGIAAKLLLVFALSLHSLALADSKVSSTQIPALLELRDSLQGNKSHLSSWDDSNDCSKWLGLKCDANGLVTEINLYSSKSITPPTNFQTPGYEPPPLTLNDKQLIGSISSSIGNLTSLKKLYISGNQLSGGIPSTIGNLVNLEILDLTSNYLSGIIPSSIANLPKLRLLFLSYNSLTGPIPEEIRDLTGLLSLDLNTNYLNGSIPDLSNLVNLTAIILGSNDFSRSSIPAWIGNLTKVQYLDIRGSNLNGVIPSLNTLPKLNYLDLSFNFLTGTITSQFNNVTTLNTLILSTNSLSGPIPPVLGKLPLSSIDFSRNAFTGDIPSDFGGLGENLFLLDLTSNSLNGTIPSSISDLSSLAAVSFGSNQLTGSIPESITIMPSLSDFFVDSNSLTGQIPVAIGNISLLNFFVVSNNQLSGPLPNNLSVLSGLVNLLVDNNTFSGQLPPELGNLYSLTVLDASKNIFTGIIPPSFGNLRNLTNLRLFQNSLQGPIPNLSNLTELLELDLSLNALTGPVPDNLSPSLIKLNLRSNSLSGPVPKDLITRLPNLTTLDLSTNQLTGVPTLNTSSSSLSFIALASSQFTSDSSDKSPEFIRIFGDANCSITDVCYKQRSYYTANPLLCDKKCLGQEAVNPVLYSNPSSCSCSPPMILNIQLYAPLFYIFNGNESSNVVKYFAGVTDLPEVQVVVQNANATVTNQVTFDLSLYLFTTDTEKWSVRRSIEVLSAMYGSQGKREDPRIGPYRVISYTVTDKGSASSDNSKNSSGVDKWVVILVACLAAFAIISVVIVALIFIRIAGNRKKMGKLENEVMEGMARAMSLAEVQQATKYFSEDLLLGAGGFGSVYKGVSKNGTIWAVKRAKKVSLQSKTEFENEVLAISRMNHINLVKLLGYCDEQNEQILIYEFMSKGTLRNALDPSRAGVTRPVLTFDERLHIAVGSAAGLNYLHSGATQTIIHRDIKSENILLDSNLTAKVADFGLLKKNGVEDIDSSENTKLAGTPGYMDPEYYTTYKVTTKSDVYSFGVVLLELLTGKAPIMEDRTTIRSKYDQDAVSMITVTKWAVPHIETGKITDIIDPLLEGNFDPRAAEAFAHVAFACVRKQGAKRPDMAIVTAQLRDILEAVRSGNDIVAGHFSVAPSEADSHILEPPIPSNNNSGVSGFYAPSNISFGR